MREGGAAAAPGRAGVAVPRRVRGEGHGVGLSEGLREGGVLRHVRLMRLILLERVTEARQHRMLGIELAVPRYQHWRQH